MPRVASPTVVRQIESLFDGGSISGLTDQQLLERFSTNGGAAGESAFAALVRRHGPLVLGISRQLVGDQHLAEDVFQAVFLVLARKARSVRDPDLLGNWLYGVTLRTARKAKVRLLSRRKREGGDFMTHPDVCSDVPDVEPIVSREQADALHNEIERLPVAFRQAVVLCYFEGRTVEEAAEQLKWPHGTVCSRLARARDKLRRGLARRGVVLSAAASTLLLSQTATAAISSTLCDNTTRAAIRFAAGKAGAGAVSASAMALAHQVLRSMLLTKLRFLALSCLFVGAVATGAGLWNHSLAMKDEPVKNPTGEVPPRATRSSPHLEDQVDPTTKANGNAPGRMTVAGRVLDPDGKPVKGAAIDLVTRPRVPWVGASEKIDQHALLGQAQSDRDGRFQLDSPRTASTGVFEMTAIAAADGYGFGWAELNPDAKQPTADIRLQPEHIVRIRLVDLTGAPVKGVEVTFLGVTRESDTATNNGIYVDASSSTPVRVWPRPVKTDEQGRITFRGIGPAAMIGLRVTDLRYARQDLYIDSKTDGTPRETTFALQPAQIIEGQVLAADTGRPIPNAVVSATTRVHNQHANGFFSAKFRADVHGRFVINPIAGESITLGAFPTGAEPYLIQQDELKWPKGTVKLTHDIKVRRGVLVRGKVTEQGTDRPLAASSIEFIPVRGGDTVLSGWQAIVASQEDGTFQIAVAAGKGHLLVFGPTGDYVLGEIGSNQLYNDKPGGIRYYSHAFIPYDVKPGDSPREVAAALRPGVTIKAHVIGPDGQTITDGFIITTLRIEAFNPHWRGDYQIPIRDGQFELHGLAPEASTRIHVLAPGHEWGASVEVSGKQGGEDLIVRLQPCGQAKARFVGPDGKPVAKMRPHFELVVTPGPSRMSRNQREQAELAADAELVANIDRKHYWRGPSTDAEGRITLPALIPRALYRIIDFSTVRDQDKGVQIRRDFTVKAGETLELGDILIEKPGS